MNAIDALRGEIAEQHGLGVEAASLIVGETVDQIEQSAAALGEFVDAHTARQTPAAETDPISAALAGKAARKRQLTETLLGHRPQPRNQRGQYASFDGGARSPVPEPRDPEAEHSKLAADLIAQSRQSRGLADAGGNF